MSAEDLAQFEAELEALGVDLEADVSAESKQDKASTVHKPADLTATSTRKPSAPPSSSLISSKPPSALISSTPPKPSSQPALRRGSYGPVRRPVAPPRSVLVTPFSRGPGPGRLLHRPIVRPPVSHRRTFPPVGRPAVGPAGVRHVTAPAHPHIGAGGPMGPTGPPARHGATMNHQIGSARPPPPHGAVNPHIGPPPTGVSRPIGPARPPTSHSADNPSIGPARPPPAHSHGAQPRPQSVIGPLMGPSVPGPPMGPSVPGPSMGPSVPGPPAAVAMQQAPPRPVGPPAAPGLLSRAAGAHAPVVTGASYQPSAQERRKHANREVAGRSWYDPSLEEWPESDFRLFVTDLGKEATDRMLSELFGKYESFAKAKAVVDKQGNCKGFGFVSFLKFKDSTRALKEMQGAYVGTRPIRVLRSNWNKRSKGKKRGR